MKTQFPDFRGNRKDLAKVVDNLIVVGGTTDTGKLAKFSQTAPWITINAPAANVWTPYDDATLKYIFKSGTSLGK